VQNTLRWQTGYLGRQSPVLPANPPRLARKVKPLCLFYEREVAAYALVRGIDYIYDECPHSEGAKTLYYKELLNKLEDRSLGAKQHFYVAFLKAKRERLVTFAEPAATEISQCQQCGQPTSAAGFCAFCRMWDDPIIKAHTGESP
jgi:tRNA-5-methyluridine54 2-sulfurtransferase